MKLLALLSATCAFVLCYGVFLMKQDVMKLERQNRTLQQDIAATQQAIHVLKAEWAYLTRPDYVRQLAAVYLDNMPLTSAQIVRLDELAPAPALVAANGAATTVIATAQ